MLCGSSCLISSTVLLKILLMIPGMIFLITGACVSITNSHPPYHGCHKYKLYYQTHVVPHPGCKCLMEDMD